MIENTGLKAVSTGTRYEEASLIGSAFRTPTVFQYADQQTTYDFEHIAKSASQIFERSNESGESDGVSKQ